jgi:hypothetical protein
VRGNFPRPTKRLRFAYEGTSTLSYRKMRSRPRLRLRPTQRPCKRVSSSCTLYEVFGNYAWRSAPPRKRVTQSEKAPALRDRECPRPTGLSVDSLLHCNKGNGNGGNSVRKGESFTPPSSGFNIVPFQGIPRQARNDNKQSRKSACIFSACAEDSKTVVAAAWPHFSIEESDCCFTDKLTKKPQIAAVFWFFC